MMLDSFNLIAGALADPLCLLSTEGVITAVNPLACKMLNAEDADLAGRHIQAWLSPEQIDQFNEHLQTWSAGKQTSPIMLEICHDDNTAHECLCYGSRLNSETNEASELIILQCKETRRAKGYTDLLNSDVDESVEVGVTDKRETKGFRERVEQLNLLLDSAGEAIYGIDMQGICTYVNASCLRLLGYQRPDELLGKNMHELIHHKHADGSHYPVEACEIYQAQHAGSSIKADHEVFWRKDGCSFPVEYFAHPILRDGIMLGSVVTSQDISDKKEIEAALNRSQETLERAQAIAHVGSWDWDIVSGALHWTDEIYRIFGLQPQEFGATYEAFLQYIHPDDVGAVTQAVNATVADKNIPYDIEHRVVQPNGTERIVNERGKVYRDAMGTPIRMIGTVQDITEKKQADEKIRKLNEELEVRVEQRTAELKSTNQHLQASLQELNEMQGKLVESEKMAALGGLVAGVAHEINTPIGVGVTAVSHLQMKLDEYKSRYQGGQLTRDDFEAFLKTTSESSDIIQHNLHRAVELIRSFKQVAVDQTSNKPRSFNLAQYLGEVLQSLKPNLKQGIHDVVLDCPDDIELFNHPGSISQVITNLIMNSIIHAFDDAETGCIRIGVSRISDTAVRLEYTDDGKGISPENVQKIFEPFFTTRRGQGGSGLGMHIVYNLVTRSLGGMIHCSSVEGEGTRFMIELPISIGRAVIQQQKRA